MVKTKNRVGRPAKVDTMLQTREVAAMLLMCKSRSEIIEYCCNTYGVRESSCSHIISRAYAYISDTHAVDKTGIVHTHIELYYDIYKNATTLGDSRGAIQALNSIEKLLKLTDNTLVQNNTLTVNLKDLTLTELKELLQLKV